MQSKSPRTLSEVDVRLVSVAALFGGFGAGVLLSLSLVGSLTLALAAVVGTISATIVSRPNSATAIDRLALFGVFLAIAATLIAFGRGHLDAVLISIGGTLVFWIFDRLSKTRS